MRVGDREREWAGAALRRHFVQGRLSTAELADRIGLTLRARSQDDLDAALDDLPSAWRELPARIHAARWRARRSVRRLKLLVALVRMWLKVNLALVLALGVALVVGAPVAMTVGAVVAGWAVATFGFWRWWRRRATSV